MTKLNEVEKAVSHLTEEAKTLLNAASGCHFPNSNNGIDRAVDCIIMASALTLTKWKLEAIEKDAD